MPAFFSPEGVLYVPQLLSAIFGVEARSHIDNSDNTRANGVLANASWSTHGHNTHQA